MACVSDIPDTLVLKIILLAGNASTTTLKEWKANLPYAGVCRQWRKQIIDMVYGSAILECYRFGVVWTGWQNKVSLPYYTWKSNIDLFVATGNNHRATELRILLPRYEHSVLPIHDRLSLFKFDSKRWKDIRSLHITYKTIAGCAKTAFKEVSKRSKKLQVQRQTGIVTYFADYLKLLVKLDLPATSKDSIYLSRLYADITNHYAFRLRFLSNPNTTIFSSSAFADNLTSLTVRLSNIRPFCLLHLNLMRIQHIRLMDVPCDFSWNRALLCDSEFYSFANLKDLHLEFSEPNSMVSNLLNYPSDSKVFKLEFPVLKRLTVRNNPSTGHLLSSCLDLPTTAEISIDGEFNGLRQLGNMCYHNTASIISVEMRRVEKDDRAHFYMVTNDLYGRLTGANEMRLVLDDIGITIDPQQIEWLNLTQLALKQGISFMNVTKLVSILPSLTFLYIGWLDVDMAANIYTISRLTGKASRSISQLDTRINTLCIYANSSPDASKFMLDPVLYLTASMPWLTSLHVPEMHIAATQDDLARFSQYYPHLAQIGVSNTVELSNMFVEIP